jgi:hypothetical protein
MTFTTGTSHFVSKPAAIRYYRHYGYDEPTRAVERKIAEKEISIGAPEVKQGQRAYLDMTEGRYFIEEQS